MPLDRRSKIREAWCHPAGHDLLLVLMRQVGRDESWPARRFVASMNIGALDKIGGPEFTDLLLETVNAAPEPVPEEGRGEGPAWWKQATGYRVYLPSFMDADHDGVGDIAGVHQRLPYLEELGIDLLWLSPVWPEGADVSHDPVGLLPDLGVAEDLEGLVSAAHARGMRVVLDVDATCETSKLAAGLGFWRAKGVDGFCFLNLNLLGRSPELLGLKQYVCGPKLHASVRELCSAMRGSGPVFLAGEVPLASPNMAKLFTAPGRQELDLILQPGFLQHGVLGPDMPRALDLLGVREGLLRWVRVCGNSLWMPLMLQTADLPRVVSRVGASPVYRATLAKMLATMMFALRGTPLLYQGEELGLPNTRFGSIAELRDEKALHLYEEACTRLGEKAAFELAAARTADHARTPFPWSAGPGGGFTGAEPWLRLTDGYDRLSAQQQMLDGDSVWSHYRRLIELRRENEALVYGEVKPVFNHNRKVLCFFRLLEGEKWYVEVNLTASETSRPGRLVRSMKLELSNYESAGKTLRPFEANVYYCES